MGPDGAAGGVRCGCARVICSSFLFTCVPSCRDASTVRLFAQRCGARSRAAGVPCSSKWVGLWTVPCRGYFLTHRPTRQDCGLLLRCRTSSSLALVYGGSVI